MWGAIISPFFLFVALFRLAFATPPSARDTCEFGSFDLYNNEGFCVSWFQCDAKGACPTTQRCITLEEGLCLKEASPLYNDNKDPVQSFGPCDQGKCREGLKCFKTPLCIPIPKEKGVKEKKEEKRVKETRAKPGLFKGCSSLF
jgi:hypothetical protein